MRRLPFIEVRFISPEVDGRPARAASMSANNNPSLV